MQYNFQNDTIRWQMSQSINFPHTILYQLLKKNRFRTLKKQVKVMQYIFLYGTIRCQMSKSTNVSHTFLHQLLPFQRCTNFKIVTLKKQDMVTQYNFCNDYDAIRQQMSKSTNGSRIFFVPALSQFQIYKKFKILTFKTQVKVTEYI